MEFYNRTGRRVMVIDEGTKEITFPEGSKLISPRMAEFLIRVQSNLNARPIPIPPNWEISRKKHADSETLVWELLHAKVLVVYDAGFEVIMASDVNDDFDSEWLLGFDYRLPFSFWEAMMYYFYCMDKGVI